MLLHNYIQMGNITSDNNQQGIILAMRGSVGKDSEASRFYWQLSFITGEAVAGGLEGLLRNSTNIPFSQGLLTPGYCLSRYMFVVPVENS